METEQHLHLRLPRKAIAKMGGLLGQGLLLKSPVGITLWDFLCNRLGLGEDYVQDKLQTVFVNGRAVDRFDTVHIKDGDTIALSSAMPGLVGATLRRGGHLAQIRAEISYQEDQDSPPTPADGTVLLKMFNVVARESGEQALAGQVWVPAQVLLPSLDLLQAAGYLNEEGACLWNGKPSPPGDVARTTATGQLIALEITWL